MRNRDILFIIRLRNETRRQFRGLNQDLKRLTRDATAASAATRRLQRQTKSAGRQVAATTRSFNAAGLSLSRLRGFAFAAGAVLATLGLGLGIGSAINTLADFSQGIQNVSAVTGAVGAELEGVRTEIERLGISTRFSATQAAEGAAFLGRAGFDTSEILDTLAGTLSLAQAGLLDIGSAADIASNVLRGFRLDTEETGRVVDILAFAANNSNTNVRQLGDGLKLVAPIAAGLGVSIEETTAAIGELSNAGLQATLAGTGLRRILAELESPSRKTQKIFKAFGVTTDQVKVSQVGLVSALETLRVAGIGAGVGLEIFGQRGGPAFEVLAGGTEEVRKLTLALIEQEDTARKTAEVQDKSLRGALLRTRSAIQGVIIEAGKLGAEGSLIEFLDNITTGFREFAESAQLESIVGNTIAVLRRLDTVFKILVATAAGFLGLKLAAGFLALGKGAVAAAAGLNLLSLATLRAAFAASTLAKALAIGFIIIAFKELLDLVKDFNEEIDNGVTTWDLFGAAGVGVLVAIRESILNGISGVKLLASSLAQLVKGDFLGALASVREGFDLLTEDIDFKGAIEDELRELALAAQQRTREVGQVAGDAFAEGLAAAGGLEPVANQKAEEFASAFNLALQGFAGGRPEFAIGLQALVQEFAPGIVALAEFEERLDLLDIALKASNKELSAFGITQADLLGIQKSVIEAQEKQTNLFAQEIEGIERRIDLLGLSTNAQRESNQFLEVANKLAEEGIVLTAQQEARLRSLLRAESARIEAVDAAKKQAQAEKALATSIDTTLNKLRGEQELLGLTGDELERRRVLLNLENQAKRLGLTLDPQRINNIEEEVAALQAARRAFDADAFAGARAGLKGFIDDARDLNAQFESFTRDTLDGLTDAFNTFVNEGKFSFADLTNSILRDLQRIATNKIFASLLGSVGGLEFGSLFGGGGGGGGGVLSGFPFAKGGVVGKDGTPTLMAASAFKNAKKFQRGGPVSRSGTDSVPILATPGEIILNQDQADVLRRAVSGRSVGSLTSGASTSRTVNDTSGPIDVNVTMIVQGVSDVEGFRRSSQNIAADLARSTNKAFRRNG